MCSQAVLQEGPKPHSQECSRHLPGCGLPRAFTRGREQEAAYRRPLPLHFPRGNVESQAHTHLSIRTPTCVSSEPWPCQRPRSPMSTRESSRSLPKRLALAQTHGPKPGAQVRACLCMNVCVHHARACLHVAGAQHSRGTSQTCCAHLPAWHLRTQANHARKLYECLTPNATVGEPACHRHRTRRVPPKRVASLHVPSQRAAVCQLHA